MKKEDPVKYCRYCNKLLTRKRYNGRLEDLNVFKKRLYCDYICMRKDKINISINNASWSNSHTTARNINKLFINVAQCEMCGKDGKLDVHHKDGNYQNNKISNLQILCRSCHNKVHRGGRVCVICGNKHKALGYCDKHYQQFRKNKNTTELI